MRDFMAWWHQKFPNPLALRVAPKYRNLRHRRPTAVNCYGKSRIY